MIDEIRARISASVIFNSVYGTEQVSFLTLENNFALGIRFFEQQSESLEDVEWIF